MAERKSLLSSQARIQSPWIKVTIGSFTFGVFDKPTKLKAETTEGFFQMYDVQYPNYVQSLSIVKVNGQINKYTLNLTYPVRPNDDPNFFEKVFSGVSRDRKITFSYGDASMPAYVYKNEEAIITKVTQSFNLRSSSISYVVSAVSTAIKGRVGNFTFPGRKAIPSEVIKEVFKNTNYGLRGIFTGMDDANLNELIAGDDKKVELTTKVNISPIDYISYLVSCMIPAGSTLDTTSKDIYILTLHDDTIYDGTFEDYADIHGPYFKVTRTTYATNHSDAYEVDIGYNTSTIVTDFSITNDENYSIYYEYGETKYPDTYVRRLNNNGQWEDVYAPTVTSGNEHMRTLPNDITWYTKLTKYPISASITIQGLLRPATLMQYLRLNVIFPGGHKHIASGLYIVTRQVDSIGDQGYKTTLSLTRIAGDDTLGLGQVVTHKTST